MRFLKNVSVKWKGLFSVVLLAVLLAVIGFTGLNNLDSIKDASEDISDNYAESISLLGSISADFESLNQVIYAHVLAEDSARMSTLTKKSQTLMTQISDNCKEFEESLDAGQETENYNKFQNLYKQYVTYFNQALNYSNSNDDDKAASLINNELTNMGDQIDAAISQMTA